VDVPGHGGVCDCGQLDAGQLGVQGRAEAGAVPGQGGEDVERVTAVRWCVDALTVRDCERPGLTATKRAVSHARETTLACGDVARSEGLEPPTF
jgi:hypothetical protein